MSFTRSFKSFSRLSRMCLYQMVGRGTNFPISNSSSTTPAAIHIQISEFQHNYIDDDINDLPSYDEPIKLHMTNFIDFLCEKFICSEELATDICHNYPEYALRTLYDVKKNVNLLLEKGVTREVILDNPWIITLNCEYLNCNLRILEEMKPKNINDFVPLIRVSFKKLKELKEIAVREENNIPNNHRIYYISTLMNIEPTIVCKFVSKQLFLLEMEFVRLDDNLKVFLKYIHPMDILNSPKNLTRCPVRSESQLSRVKDHVKKCLPWMAQCQEKQLVKLIQTSVDERAILCKRSLDEYLSYRLQCDNQTLETIMKKSPYIRRSSVKRLKEMLDFVLDESGYKPIDIIMVPRILCRSLNTIKIRFREMQILKYRQKISLNILCKDTKSYERWKREQKSYDTKISSDSTAMKWSDWINKFLKRS